MNKKSLTAYEKVLIRIGELCKTTELESSITRIEDEEGVIVAFKNGIVLLKDGNWYERQYEPFDTIFKSQENRRYWKEYLSLQLDGECGNEIREFNNWLSGKKKIPSSITYYGITQSSIYSLSEERIDDDMPMPAENVFPEIKVFVLPIIEVNRYIQNDKSDRFNKEESAANVDMLTYDDCRKILGKATDKNICDYYADCYSIEEFQNQINFSVNDTFNNNYYIKFTRKS